MPERGRCCDDRPIPVGQVHATGPAQPHRRRRRPLGHLDTTGLVVVTSDPLLTALLVVRVSVLLSVLLVVLVLSLVLLASFVVIDLAVVRLRCAPSTPLPRSSDSDEGV